jgi:hypothetical protein
MSLRYIYLKLHPGRTVINLAIELLFLREGCRRSEKPYGAF